ncbi:neuritin-like protein [Lates japonicus]|uniref:Neuritin-like protein n=1 Tax=Lates japonicus TaxID=270547 RepID=A0AAD3RDD4_LATJO|nr:neuritin-like protein [Lates japonicus]
MGFFMSTKIGGILAFALVFLSLTVSGDSPDVKCENIYKDFSDCVLELGESMDNYQENVTSERGVAAVCRRRVGLMILCLPQPLKSQSPTLAVSSIWETLRHSRKMRFQGSLFDPCSPSSAPSISSHLVALALPLMLIMAGPNWSSV